MTVVVATYWWSPDAGSKFTAPYKADDVRKLQRAVARNCTVPHEFAVITDQPELFAGDSNIRAIPLDRATHVPKTCFARLMTFHPKGREIIGERVLQLDLDTKIVGNIDHLVTREEDLVLWRNPTRLPWADIKKPADRIRYAWETRHELRRYFDADGDWSQNSIQFIFPKGHPEYPDGFKTYLFNQIRTYYNTSVLFHRCGTMPEVWSEFDPNNYLPKGWPGGAYDDQWYLSDRFGMSCPYFDGERDGVYRRARDDTPNSGIDGDKKNACVLTFPGSHGKMDDGFIARNPWIKEHLV
jgi:hypothetical protein